MDPNRESLTSADLREVVRCNLSIWRRSASMGAGSRSAGYTWYRIALQRALMQGLFDPMKLSIQGSSFSSSKSHCLSCGTVFMSGILSRWLPDAPPLRNLADLRRGSRLLLPLPLLFFYPAVFQAIDLGFKPTQAYNLQCLQLQRLPRRH